MVFVAGAAFSQVQVAKDGRMILLQTPTSKPIHINGAIKAGATLPLPKPVIAPDFYVTQLGFFCKQEIKFEKAIKIPFRFRLGSVDDCDRMEGKRRLSITGQ
jgi:hypothetical protein